MDPKCIWLGKGNNCQTAVGLGGGLFPPSGQDLAGWTQMVFRDSLYKVFLIIFTCMSETFLTYKSDVCLDCIV